MAFLAALGMGEAFLVSRYAHGDVSSREWQNPFSIHLGTVAGSVAGTWVGQTIGTLAADRYYDWRFAELDRKFGEFVYDRYGIK